MGDYGQGGVTEGSANRPAGSREGARDDVNEKETFRDARDPFEIKGLITLEQAATPGGPDVASDEHAQVHRISMRPRPEQSLQEVEIP